MADEGGEGRGKEEGGGQGRGEKGRGWIGKEREVDKGGGGKGWVAGWVVNVKWRLGSG